uniref:Uncharacterized protein n=1 Tax=Meloidogyne javanica TaxID=6303 RepID=A0A915M736_MELJA
MKNYKFCIIALLVIYLFILQCEANIKSKNPTLEKENNFGSEIYPPSNKFQKEENKIEPYPEPSDNFQ